MGVTEGSGDIPPTKALPLGTNRNQFIQILIIYFVLMFIFLFVMCIHHIHRNYWMFIKVSGLICKIQYVLYTNFYNDISSSVYSTKLPLLLILTFGKTLKGTHSTQFADLDFQLIIYAPGSPPQINGGMHINNTGRGGIN